LPPFRPLVNGVIAATQWPIGIDWRVNFGPFIPIFCNLNGLDFLQAAAQ
jgi:hypothetical protein